eukprot:6889979-Prymnesium_polylepis.1
MGRAIRIGMHGALRACRLRERAVARTSWPCASQVGRGACRTANACGGTPSCLAQRTDGDADQLL